MTEPSSTPPGWPEPGPERDPTADPPVRIPPVTPFGTPAPVDFAAPAGGYPFTSPPPPSPPPPPPPASSPASPIASPAPTSGYPASGYPASGYPASGYPASGNPPVYGNPAETYPTSGYPGSSYPTSGYPGGAYPAAGYGGYAGYGGQPLAYSPFVPAQKTNGLAIGSMVTSIAGIALLVCYGVGVLVGLVGAILGHVARRQIRDRQEAGDGMALAGVIVGWVAVGLGLLFVGLFVALVAMVGDVEPSNSDFNGFNIFIDRVAPAADYLRRS